jgi:uncharacterized membrane protein
VGRGFGKKAVSAFPARAAGTAVALFALSCTAQADFQLCNRMSYVVEAAAGFEEKGSAITRGWFRINPGQCRVVVEGAVAAERFFVHARALSAYGALPTSQGGNTELCVGTEIFAIPSAARGCTRPGHHFVRFTEVKPSETERGWLANLAEEAQYSDEQARLAGIQRLLTMTGYDATPVDGLKGPKTDTALAQFLKDRSMPSEAANSPAFFDLLLDAAQKPEGTGFVWCNETANPVMAAIGNEDKGVLVTRGWYRVEPGKCTRPDIQGRPRRLYSYAEAVDAGGQVVKRGGVPLVWGGKVVLCTREAMFELSDHKECTVRGLNAAGFAAIDIAAQGATTVRFKEP